MTVYADIIGSDDRAARSIQSSRSRTVAPTEEPVTLDDLRSHARIDDDLTDDDADLETFISTARERVEQIAGIAILTQTWQIKLAAFPGGASPIYLPRSPIQSVTSIQYVDANGTTQTLSSENYEIDTGTDPASWPSRIALAYGESWPSTRAQFLPVTITGVFGWSLVADVPAVVKQAIKMLALYWYERRSAAEFLQGADIKPVPYAVSVLMSEYRTRRFG